MGRKSWPAALAATIIAAGSPARAQQTICELRAEPSELVRDCLVITGYSGGARVGDFQITEGFERKAVGATEACRLNDRYHRDLGRIVPPNRVVVGTRIFTLAPDCRSASVQ
jgi:hypothetical protein